LAPATTWQGKLTNVGKSTALAGNEAKLSTELSMINQEMRIHKHQFGIDLYKILEELEDTKQWLPTDRQIRTIYDNCRMDIDRILKRKAEKEKQIKELDGVKLDEPDEMEPSVSTSQVQPPAYGSSVSSTSSPSQPRGWASTAPVTSYPPPVTSYPPPATSQQPPAYGSTESSPGQPRGWASTAPVTSYPDPVTSQQPPVYGSTTPSSSYSAPVASYSAPAPVPPSSQPDPFGTTPAVSANQGLFGYPTTTQQQPQRKQQQPQQQQQQQQQTFSTQDIDPFASFASQQPPQNIQKSAMPYDPFAAAPSLAPPVPPPAGGFDPFSAPAQPSSTNKDPFDAFAGL
jgi:hypothetical protein